MSDKVTEEAITKGLDAAYQLGFHEAIGVAAAVAKGPRVKLNDARHDIPQKYRDQIAAEILARGAA